MVSSLSFCYFSKFFIEILFFIIFIFFEVIFIGGFFFNFLFIIIITLFIYFFLMDQLNQQEFQNEQHPAFLIDQQRYFWHKLYIQSSVIFHV